jgi:acyl-CoA synthetase (AMP-forming)/AMP-acid ligase II
MVSGSTAKGPDGTLVHCFLERSAAELPDKTAVVHNEHRATYAEVNAKANAVAGWLIQNGAVKGDRVVLMMENGLDYIAGYYGALKAGAAAVPLSPELKAAAIGSILSELAPKAVIASKRAEAEIKALDPGLLKGAGFLIREPRLKWDGGVRVHAWEDLGDGDRGHDFQINLNGGDLASIIYTSGSTGKPKGVMLTHANIVANTASICSCLRIGADDIQMVVLPFHYVMGKSLLNTHFAAGATVVLNNSFAFPASVVKELVKENVTAFSGVPSTFAYLLHRSPLKKYRDQLSTLRYCSQAGGHMADRIKRDLRETLPPHTDILIMYGATEASARLTYLEPEMFTAKLGSIGKPVDGVYIKVLNEKGVEAGAGEVGELVASGPNIMWGYWKDPESTAKALDGNGYHTGDLGFRDENGYFYVTGRKDNLIKVGGRWINPQEVEDAMLATGLAVECAIVGIEDPLLGMSLAAAVVVKDKTVDHAALLNACSERLPKHKVPSWVEIVGKLPLNNNGKVDKTACLSLLRQPSPRQTQKTQQTQ